MWTKILTVAQEAYQDDDGQIIYYRGFDGAGKVKENGWETIVIPASGLRKILYQGKSQMIAKRRMKKFMREHKQGGLSEMGD